MIFFRSLIYLIPLLILLSGCREEIIPPGNTAGNVNEPVQQRTNNSYSFLINAENISSNVIDYPSLNAFRTRIFMNIRGESSGSVEITFYNDDRLRLYSFLMDDELKVVSNNYEGDSPDVVEIHFRNFTGNLEIKLTRIQ
jgi:hypothetical protein